MQTREISWAQNQSVSKHLIKFMPPKSHHKWQRTLFLYFQCRRYVDKVWLDFLTHDMSKCFCCRKLWVFSGVKSYCEKRIVSHLEARRLAAFSIPSCHLRDLIWGKNGKLLEQIFSFPQFSLNNVLSFLPHDLHNKETVLCYYISFISSGKKAPDVFD